jgi:endonuclease YncB( thermonuclease family)
VTRLLAILFLFASPIVSHAREWIDADAKHHVEAELVDFQGGLAYLKKDSGHIVAVPLRKLSSTDRSFVESSSPEVKAIRGFVVGVTDGDTLTVLSAQVPIKIRLASIDAPESHQDFGTRSKQALSEKAFHKAVVIEWREKDRYGRTVGQVFVDGRWINREMVDDGWAWHYRKYSKSEVLAYAESEAKAAKRGLWAADDPIEPWVFRRPRTKGTPAAGAPTTGLAADDTDSEPAVDDPAGEPPQPTKKRPSARGPPKSFADDPPKTDTADATVYVTSSGSKYHSAGCRYLRSSSIPMKLDDAAKGHSPCSACHPPVANANRGSTTSSSPFARSSSSGASAGAVDRNPYGEQATGSTATGIPTYTGPRGGQYHYSSSGKKVYERHKR